MVSPGQQFRLPLFHPLRRGGGLAFGAMAVAARVIGDLPMPPPVAPLDMAAKCGGPAGRDVAQGAALLRREHIAIEVEEGVAMVPEDIGHFEPVSRHGWSRPSFGGMSRSSGLWVASRAAVETWV